MFTWEIPNLLARSARPGHGWGKDTIVPREIVELWTTKAQKNNIKSILCLLSATELRLYANLPDGLLGYYRKCGFKVGHVPVEDYQDPPLTPEQEEEVLKTAEGLPKPLLIHCSAGISRSG